MEKEEVFCLSCQHVDVYIDEYNLEKISCDHPICFGEPEIHKNIYEKKVVPGKRIKNCYSLNKNNDCFYYEKKLTFWQKIKKIFRKV